LTEKGDCVQAKALRVSKEGPMRFRLPAPEGALKDLGLTLDWVEADDPLLQDAITEGALTERLTSFIRSIERSEESRAPTALPDELAEGLAELSGVRAVPGEALAKVARGSASAIEGALREGGDPSEVMVALAAALLTGSQATSARAMAIMALYEASKHPGEGAEAAVACAQVAETDAGALISKEGRTVVCESVGAPAKLEVGTAEGITGVTEAPANSDHGLFHKVKSAKSCSPTSQAGCTDFARTKWL